MAQFSENNIRSLMGRHLIVDRKFQIRYTLGVLSMIFGVAAPMALVCLYFINENYNVFIDLSLRIAPELQPHLLREQLWMNSFVLISLGIGGLITGFITLRITGNLVRPLILMREHMKALSRGHWGSPDLHVREDDEFFDVIESYQYLFKSLKFLNKNETERLQVLASQLQEESSKKICNELIKEKSQRTE